METNKIIHGDCLEVLKTLPSESIDMCISSPPYWALRDYNVSNAIGLEPNWQDWIQQLIRVYTEIWRVLKPTGTCWVNLGDTYSSPSKGSGGTGLGYATDAFKSLARRANHKGLTEKHFTMPAPTKSLCLMPHRFAIAMIDNGWILRNEIIWHKVNPLPESVKDRFTRDFEYLYFFTKQEKYYYEMQFEKLHSIPADYDGNRHNQGAYVNQKSIADNSVKKKRGFKTKNIDTGLPPSHHGKDIHSHPEGRNKRCVWSIPVQPFGEEHAATYPEDLIKTPILAGCPEGGIILDPFMGAGTTALVSLKLRRQFIGIELNPEYIKIANRRIEGELNQRKLKLA